MVVYWLWRLRGGTQCKKQFADACSTPIDPWIART
jgi:hypothetical protein